MINDSIASTSRWVCIAQYNSLHKIKIAIEIWHWLFWAFECYYYNFWANKNNSITIRIDSCSASENC